MGYPVVQWKRHVPGGVDADGYRVPDTFREPVTIPAAFAPESTLEPREGLGVRVVSDAQLVLREPIDYDARDVFLVDGVPYQAEGVTPAWWGMFSRRRFGQVIKLRGFDVEAVQAEP